MRAVTPAFSPRNVLRRQLELTADTVTLDLCLQEQLTSLGVTTGEELRSDPETPSLLRAVEAATGPLLSTRLSLQQRRNLVRLMDLTSDSQWTPLLSALWLHLHGHVRFELRLREVDPDLAVLTRQRAGEVLAPTYTWRSAGPVQLHETHVRAAATAGTL